LFSTDREERRYFLVFRHLTFIPFLALAKIGLRKEKDALQPESICFPELKEGENPK
jgi:hypothetical protein